MAVRFQKLQQVKKQAAVPDFQEQLEMAGRVQRNFLPSRMPNNERFHFAALFHPADYVSGDIYDARRLDESHIGFYLADAVGHSIPAALLTIFIKQATIMRQTYVNTYEIFNPQKVIEHLNMQMVEQELKGCLFATSCYFLLNTESLKVSWCRAGHPYPILIRDNKPKQLLSRGGLLGVFEKTEFEEKSQKLYPGDKLLVYSDGTEPLLGQSDANGNLRFKSTFFEICSLSAEEIIQVLHQQARQFHPDPSEKDDITALCLQVL